MLKCTVLLLSVSIEIPVLFCESVFEYCYHKRLL